MRAVRAVLTLVGVFWIAVGLLGPVGCPALIAGVLLLWAGLVL